MSEKVKPVSITDLERRVEAIYDFAEFVHKNHCEENGSSNGYELATENGVMRFSNGPSETNKDFMSAKLVYELEDEGVSFEFDRSWHEFRDFLTKDFSVFVNGKKILGGHLPYRTGDHDRKYEQCLSLAMPKTVATLGRDYSPESMSGIMARVLKPIQDAAREDAIMAKEKRDTRKENIAARSVKKEDPGLLGAMKQKIGGIFG